MEYPIYTVSPAYRTPQRNDLIPVLATIGPFWVPTTLIFSLFLTSSLTSSITAYLSGDVYEYDFTRLGAAVSLVFVPSSLVPEIRNSRRELECRYAYFLGLPVLVWAALKYWAGVSERTMVEIISVYGYASTIWILTSVRYSLPPLPLAFTNDSTTNSGSP